MKPSEYPDQDERTVPFAPVEKETAIITKAPDIAPHYIDTPPEPLSPIAKRNLTFGIICIVLAAFGLWLGLYYAGATAARTLIASVGACGLALLFARRRVLSQQHGILLTLGAAALFGAAIPWVEGTFRKLDGMARESLGDAPEVTAYNTLQPPPPTAATAPPAPPTIPLPDSEEPEAVVEPSEPAGKKKPVLVMRPPKDADPAVATLASKNDLEARVLAVAPPEEGSGKIIEIQKDLLVEIGGRPTIIRTGTLVPFKELNDGMVIFFANEDPVSVKMEHVKFRGPSKESPQQITKLARAEANFRYPKLTDVESKESELFNMRQKELEIEPDGREFLKNPKWPLLLAEQIALQEGWVRADKLPAEEKTDPAPVPANEAPGELPALPGELPALPGELPALPGELPVLPKALPPANTPQENAPPPKL